MKYGLAAAALCAAALLVSPADANIISTFTISPGEVTAGGTVVLQLQLSVSPDSGGPGTGYYNATFMGGVVTLGSGDGQTQYFALGGGSYASFNTVFTYPVAGIFDPFFTYGTNYSENYQTLEQTGGYYTDEPYYYSCGIFGTETCVGYNQVFHPTYSYVEHTAILGSSGNGSKTLIVDALPSPVPEPATLALMGAGLVGFTAAARRRRRKA